MYNCLLDLQGRVKIDTCTSTGSPGTGPLNACACTFVQQQDVTGSVNRETVDCNVTDCVQGHT